MWFVLGLLGYVAVGHLLSVIFWRVTQSSGVEEQPLGGHVIWWALWPLASVLLIAELVGDRIGGRLTSREAGAEVSGGADEREILRLERELGMSPLNAVGAVIPTPRTFVSLPGVAAEACRLPLVRKASDYGDRYGWQREDRSANRKELQAAISRLGQVTDGYDVQASSLRGQELLDAGEAALRQIDRIEAEIEPLFSGLSMATYGVARAACVAARGRIGTTLDAHYLEPGA